MEWEKETMNFIQNQPGVRVFYLGDAAALNLEIFLSKNGGSFAPWTGAANALGHGWLALEVRISDTAILGPLAWSFEGGDFLSQPQDLVVALSHNDVDPTALALAIADLAAGFRPNAPLNELLQRRLFQFLMALK